jgi:hypothetical protein
MNRNTMCQAAPSIKNSHSNAAVKDVLKFLWMRHPDAATQNYLLVAVHAVAICRLTYQAADNGS